jgi:hypothetical protein
MKEKKKIWNEIGKDMKRTILFTGVFSTLVLFFYLRFLHPFFMQAFQDPLIEKTTLQNGNIVWIPETAGVLIFFYNIAAISGIFSIVWVHLYHSILMKKFKEKIDVSWVYTWGFLYRKEKDRFELLCLMNSLFFTIFLNYLHQVLLYPNVSYKFYGDDFLSFSHIFIALAFTPVFHILGKEMVCPFLLHISRKEKKERKNVSQESPKEASSVFQEQIKTIHQNIRFLFAHEMYLDKEKKHILKRMMEKEIPNLTKAYNALNNYGKEEMFSTFLDAFDKLIKQTQILRENIEGEIKQEAKKNN